MVGFPCIKEVKVFNSRGCVFLKQQQQQNQNQTRKGEKKSNDLSEAKRLSTHSPELQGNAQ